MRFTQSNREMPEKSQRIRIEQESRRESEGSQEGYEARFYYKNSMRKLPRFTRNDTKKYSLIQVSLLP